jgi:hypothetical protein
MSTITLFTFANSPGVADICNKLNGKKNGDRWITAKPGKYNRDEVFIMYWWYEDLENEVKKVFSEDDAMEVVSFLKQNGKTRVLKRVYCYINLLTKTLEVYRGPDSKTEEIVKALENLLQMKFTKISLKSEDLQKIYTQHGVELKQAMFKNIYGLMYDVLRGQYLENNEKYKQYLQSFPNCLRVVSFRPNIKFLNSGKYQVTINGDKGTVKLSSNGIFKYRPRFEIRQITFLIAATLGLLS